MKLISAMALFFLGMAGMASGEENLHKMSLKQAISSAITTNNQLKSSAYTVLAAQEQASLAGLSYYPALAFEQSFSLSNAPTQAFMMKLDQGRFTQNDFLINNLNKPAAQHDFKTSLSVRQAVYDPAASAERAFARHDVKKNMLQLDAAKENIAFQVFQQYLKSKKSSAHVQATEQALKEAQENVRLAAVRSQAGMGLKSDELRAKTELFSRELEHQTAVNARTLARMRLALLLGANEMEMVEIEDDTKLLPADLNYEMLLQSARVQRKDIQALIEETEKSGASLQRARSLMYPSVGAFASYQLNAKNSPFESDNDSWLAGINLTWQLFDGFKRYHERDKARAVQNAAAENLEQARKEISLQVRESMIRYGEEQNRLYVARHTVADAEETVRLVKKRFENSLATMLELLDAQSVLHNSRSALADAEAGHLLAAGQVYYVAGTFLKEIMK